MLATLLRRIAALPLAGLLLLAGPIGCGSGGSAVAESDEPRDASPAAEPEKPAPEEWPDILSLPEGWSAMPVEDLRAYYPAGSSDAPIRYHATSPTGPSRITIYRLGPMEPDAPAINVYPRFCRPTEVGSARPIITDAGLRGTLYGVHPEVPIVQPVMYAIFRHGPWTYVLEGVPGQMGQTGPLEEAYLSFVPAGRSVAAGDRQR